MSNSVVQVSGGVQQDKNVVKVFVEFEFGQHFRSDFRPPMLAWGGLHSAAVWRCRSVRRCGEGSEKRDAGSGGGKYWSGVWSVIT